MSSDGASSIFSFLVSSKPSVSELLVLLVVIAILNFDLFYYYLLLSFLNLLFIPIILVFYKMWLDLVIFYLDITFILAKLL